MSTPWGVLTNEHSSPPATSPAFAIVLFDGVEELDWVGPWEVLATWARGWPDDGAAVFTVTGDDSVVQCAKGARVLSDHTWDDVPAFDVLIWPGGQGTLDQLGDEAVRARVRHVAEAGVLMTSVCTGALIYADSGILDGRPATTHWASLDHLASLGRNIEVRPQDRFVDDGQVVTAAGVSAGIDMALHLVARLHSAARARQVRRAIQYDPAPPV
jgi:transcriptional regulator GlxA family with amidase domain